MVVVFGNHDNSADNCHTGDATCLQTLNKHDVIEKVRGSVSEAPIKARLRVLGHCRSC